MTKRKPHSINASLERTCRALVADKHAAAVSVDSGSHQILVNWKNLRQICVR